MNDASPYLWTTHHEAIAQSLFQGRRAWVRKEMYLTCGESVTDEWIRAQCQCAVFLTELEGAPIQTDECFSRLQKSVRNQTYGEARGVIPQRVKGGEAIGDEWTAWEQGAVGTPGFRQIMLGSGLNETPLTVQSLADFARTSRPEGKQQYGSIAGRELHEARQNTSDDDYADDELADAWQSTVQALVAAAQHFCPKDYAILYDRYVLAVDSEACIDQYIESQSKPEIKAAWMQNRTLARNAYHKAVTAAKRRTRKVMESASAEYDLPRLTAMLLEPTPVDADAADRLRLSARRGGTGTPE